MTSREDWFHDFAADIGEAEVAALELEREPRVIDAEQVQDRRVEIVNVHRIAHDVVAKIVRLAVQRAAAHAAAREPDGKAAPVMIAPVVRRLELALAVSRAAEF